MTAKRFIYNVNKNCIECDGKFVAYVNSVDGFRIANKLTTLAEENEHLKSRVDYLGRKIERERNSTHKQYAKWEKEAETKIKELSEENEQLKKELKRCRDWLNSDKNDYQLTLAFIKSKGYSLKDVLEYEKELEE